jgi:hypothetical protein
MDAAIADRAPFYIGYDRLTSVSALGTPCRSDACPKHATFAVGPGYFRTMGVALLAGREFEPGTPRAEVVINQPLAKQFWPDGQALGRTLRIGEGGLAVTVVGITARTLTRGLNSEQPTLYVPFAREHFDHQLTVVIRTELAPERLARAVTDAAREVDPNVSLLSLRPMEQRVAVQLWPFRTVSWLFSVCGVLALVLASVGLGGVVSHAVNRRLREFGIRMSIGATARDLVSEVLETGARLLIPGVVAGVLLAAITAHVARAAFVGLSVLSPLTYLAVVLVEAAIVAVACVGPALRASRVEPLRSLRSE